MAAVMDGHRTLRGRSRLSLCLPGSLCWALLMISSQLACCHTDFLKGIFFSLMQDNFLTFQLEHIAIINETYFLLGSLEASVPQENEEGVERG